MGLKIGLKGAVLSVFLIGFIYSFCMSWFAYYGWTKTILLDFQNERILIYFMAFLIGSLCFKLDVFSTKPVRKKLFYFLCATIWIPMNVYIIFLINLFLNPGNFIISVFVDIVLVWLGFHLSLLGLVYVVINSFRYYLNKSGKIIQRLNSYSFGVYIVHFIIMGGIALCLLKATIPSSAKYALLTVSTYLASNLIMLLVKEVKGRVGRRGSFSGATVK